MNFKNKKYLSFSHYLADIAGKILLKNYKSLNINRYNKTVVNKKELVTNIDKKIETKVTQLIKKEFSSHNILGEEMGFTDNNSDYTWIIDPIDGTKAFVTGIPVFGFLISLRYKNSFILGDAWPR